MMASVSDGTSSPADIRGELGGNGFVAVDPMLSASACQRIREFIDAFPDDRAEINYAGTEKRIWRSHSHSPEIAEFKASADALISSTFEKNIVSRDILAIRNLPVGRASEHIQGRWHLDSLRRQIKVFLFLSDVGKENGPLELIPASHLPWRKARHAAAGHLVHLSDFLGETRRYQKLDDSWIQSVLQQTGETHLFECQAGGTFVVDTSAIHRARPSVQGHRYALTAYYDHF